MKNNKFNDDVPLEKKSITDEDSLQARKPWKPPTLEILDCSITEGKSGGGSDGGTPGS
jgi:hypothetical protein